VITLGRSGQRENILTMPPDVDLQETNRGGDVTYHGPGQLVGYPIFDLHGLRKDIAWYMRTLEGCLIEALASFGITAGRLPGLTGVWVGHDKIAAMGVHLSRWVTCHGFALNVNTDLSYFEAIVPCGIRGYGVTSMQKVLGHPAEMKDVKQAVIGSVQKGFFGA
jgi:lipoyl(octanoyl) transferase